MNITRSLVAFVCLSIGSISSPLLAQTAPPAAPPATAPRQPVSLKITDWGAVGDGKTNNTAAIQKALNACSASGGGEVIVPAGNFLTGSILLGPRTILRLEKDSILTGSPNREDYPVVNVRWEGEWRPGMRSLIAMNHVDHVGVVGEGKLVGPPPELSTLRPNASSGNPRGPSMIEPIECKDVRLEGFSLTYQRMWNVHLTYCDDVVVRNVTIRSTLTNGDGVDIDSCRNVLVEGCDIDSGDDAVCLKSGRGMEAVRIARPTENVIIRNCSLGSNFAGVGLGTEMSGGIRNVRIEHIVFTRGSNGIFVKSKTGRGGFMENVTCSDWEVKPEVHNAINFDLVTKGNRAYEEVPGLDGIPHVANLSFTNIKMTAGNLLVATAIAPEKPVENLSVSNVTGTCTNGVNVANIKNLSLKNIQVTGFQGELVKSTNVTMAAN